MTIFLTGTPYETACDLDSKRLNKQIIECYWLINMVEGDGKWKNHPCNFMYKYYIDWVKLYKRCLEEYRIYKKDESAYQEHKELAIQYSNAADKIKPPFICDALYINFKKRLYTKDEKIYNKWKSLGKTEANYYFVDGHWWKYENGKKEIDDNFAK